jgi:hypothetical protein
VLPHFDAKHGDSLLAASAADCAPGIRRRLDLHGRLAGKASEEHGA